MALATDSNGLPVICVPVSVPEDTRPHAFVAYHCSVCSYSEFRDVALPLERRQKAAPTEYARRVSDRQARNST